MIVAMTTPGLLREVRAVVFALVCLSVSVPLHTWAHGALPPLTAVLAGAGLVLGAGVLLANRRRGFGAIAGTLGVVQAGLHGLFSVVGAEPGHVMVPAHSASTMVFAHVVAGLLAAAWLFAGEVAVWRLVRWVGRRVPALFAVARLVLVVPLPRLACARRAERHVPLPRSFWSRTVARRGPPALRLR
ncbi:hypothetical protein [Cryptosporangium phraense]|uniref:Uncharacterized protein n=1 Tax=Cryptosporangium phraense TaxID=2593070 RepID=A0A545ANP8_9ACTN|nr:hypothetical protein [Cryptosporangium phraense]TQS42962.1 hypothetical protein FL583_21195 [Cryptosporangium phraense]